MASLNEEQKQSFCGALVVEILTAESKTLKPEESYLVQSNFTKGMTAGGVYRTNKSPCKQLTWHAQEHMQLIRKMVPDDQLFLTLLEHSFLPTDDTIASAVVCLTPLFEGGAQIELPEVPFIEVRKKKKGAKDEGGSPPTVATVSIRVSWKDGNIPNMDNTANKMNFTQGNASQQSIANNERNEAQQKPVIELPPTEGNDYSVRVRVHKARNLQSTKEDTLYDPLVAVQVAGETKTTDYVDDTNNPIWDEEVVLNFEKVGANWFNTPILVTVLDHHIARPNTIIGSMQLDCAAVYQENAKHVLEYKWHVLHRLTTEGHIVGFIKLSIIVVDMRKDPVPEPGPDTADQDEDEIVNNLVAGPGDRFDEVTLHCDVFRAEDIPEMDTAFPPFTEGLADPYVKFQFGKQVVITPVIYDELNPVWNSSVKLSMLLPSLTNNLAVSMWDSDKLSADDLIGMHRIPHRTLMEAGRKGLPHYSPRWVNFYGGPRGSDADYNSSFKAMVKGDRSGLDYRGRLLLRMAGSRSPKGPSPLVRVAVHETEIEFTAVVQILQLSMIPSGGYTVKASVGMYNESTNERKTHPMNQSKLHAAYFGEELRIEGKFSVIVPEDDEIDPPVNEQVPDIILHLMPHGKDVPLAAVRFPAKELLPRTEDDKEHQRGHYSCQVMTVFTDPNKTSTGEQPTDPLVQAVFGMFIRKAKGHLDEKVITGESVQMSAITPSAPEEFKLMCCCYSARQLPAGDDTGLSDPFIRVSWADGSAQTGVKMETLNPIYNELLLLNSGAKDPFPDIVVEIWDWDFFGANTFLAKKVISVNDASSEGADTTRWYSGFTDSKGKFLPDCEVLLNLEIVKVVEGNRKYFLDLPRQDFLKKVGSGEVYRGLAIPEAKQLPTSIYKIDCSIFSLRHMRSFRLMDIKCPSVIIEVAGHRVELDKIFGSNPDFNKQFELYVELPALAKYLPHLNFQVYDHRFGPPTLLGGTSALIDSKKCNPSEKALSLRMRDNDVAARLRKIDEFKGIAQKDTGTGPVRVAANMAKFKTAAKLVTTQGKLKRRKTSNEVAQGQGGVNTDLYESLLAGEDEVPDSGSGASGSGDSNNILGLPKPGTTTKNEEEMTDRSDDSQQLDDPAAVTSEVSELFLKHEEEERLEKLAAEEEAKKKEDEERLWFDRFDPAGLNVKPEQQVSRLGTVTGVLPDINAHTLEDYYGPFDDEIQPLKVMRGWGKDKTVAGTLLYDLTVQKVKAPPPGVMAVATSVPKPGVSAAEVRFLPPKAIESRQPVKFVAHVYIISCTNLAPKDDSILGRASDPYPVLQLRNRSSKKNTVTLTCKDDKKFQTLNPEFFIVREMQGILPKQDTLRISIYDYDKIGRDELIGFTDLDLESRWHSRRGYKHRNMTTLRQGSYTETRFLKNEMGQLQGSIEMWVDMYDLEYQKIPLPIEIGPPPPVPLELRAIVWNTRDVIMQETSIHGEAMTDIYVRAWLDGMSHDMQSTDVHYRSLDGTGNFNWRMKFPLVFEPRTRRIMPVNSKTTQKSFFHVRREQKKFDPVLHLQIWDNDLLPGTDDFIGECNLKLLDLRPTVSRRDPETLIGIISKEISCCCDVYPFNQCCTHREDPPESQLTLKAKQKRAAAEARHDREAQEKKWRAQAQKQVSALREIHPEYTPLQLERLQQTIFNDLRHNAMMSVFKEFLPTSKKKKLKDLDDAETSSAADRRDKGNKNKEKERQSKKDDDDDEDSKEEKKKKKKEDSGEFSIRSLLPGQRSSADGKAKDSESGSGLPQFADLPHVAETPKYWFPCRGPNGGGRVGDVQVSFQLVRSDLLTGDDADRSLLAGKGRSQPNALPEPDRPDSSFFWLSSPWKSAVHILWKNYKWYFVTVCCLVILTLFIYVFLSEGTRTKAKTFFDTGSFDAKKQTTVVNVVITPAPTPAPPTQ